MGGYRWSGTLVTQGTARWAVVIGVTAAQFAVTCLPTFQALLGIAPVPLADGVLIVGVGVAFFAVVEIEKQIRLGLQARGGARKPARASN